MKTSTDDNNEFIAPFEMAYETKPITVYDSLLPELLPLGRKKILPRGSSYKICEENDGMGVIILIEGLLTYCSLPTHTFIGTLFPPSLLGVATNYAYYYDVPGKYDDYYYAETEVTFFFVPLETFISVMDEKNLWHDIARLLAHRLLSYSSKYQSNAKSDSYETIKSLIIELWNYPERYRLNIKLPNFILRRTGISRSRIMKILSDLKTGGYIDIDNGILMRVNHLPKSY